MNQLKGGLTKLPPDSRDFSLGAITVLPQLKDLPDKFLLPYVKVYDQSLYDDFCTGCTVAALSSLQEKTALDFRYAFAAGKTGNVSSYGNDLRSAFQGQVNIGAISEDETPADFKDIPSNKARDLNNWPEELKPKALEHSKESYFKVDGPYSPYDNIRATLIRFMDEFRGVGIGLEWGWPLSLTKIDTPAQGGSGHAMAIVGYDGDYAVALQSYGLDAGQNGLVYLHKSIINKYVGIYGAFMFHDMTAEEYQEKLKAYGNNWLQNVWAKILSILQSIVNIQKKQVDEVIPIDATPPPPAQPITPDSLVPKYLWDTPENARHSVRVICDEEGLSVADKNTLCSVISCESGFNTQAKNENKDTSGKVVSTDYGICQFNDFYYIGSGKPIASVDEALNNPEKCVRVMIQQFKAGNLKHWVCFSSGKYKSYS